MTPASRIESTVAERARQDSDEALRTSCSLAQAERLLGQEYHGRFLIELLQNAADAWRAAAAPGERSKLAVVLTEEPALLIANCGAPFPAEAVLESLGHIGASTKDEGNAIGHKGIGFKSVLEVTLTPELYSGLQDEHPLALRFDPRAALGRIRAEVPHWDELRSNVRAVRDDPLKAVPVLRFPTVQRVLPEDVARLQLEGFQTVVRLPFNDDLRPTPDLDRAAWVEAVRTGLRDVTDEMLLLLGTFDRVVVSDLPAGRSTTVRPTFGERRALADGVELDRVQMLRDDVVSSSWLLYRHKVDDVRGDLAGETAVGVCTDGDGPRAPIVPVYGVDRPDVPFHLFFPTQISSGLPLLLHGYFRVNASRTGFFSGSRSQNDAILGNLAGLVVTAIDDLVTTGAAETATLANHLAHLKVPEDEQAAAFREDVLTRLDDVAWVPVADAHGAGRHATPAGVLVDRATTLVERVVSTFPAAYVQRRTGLRAPGERLGGQGRAFLASRPRIGAPSIWEIVLSLCRPGADAPWPAGEEDERFGKLLQLVAALNVENRAETASLLDALRADDRSRLLPVATADGSRELLPVVDPQKVAGRAQRVMVRRGVVGGAPLMPPAELGIAFLPDGVYTEEQVNDARPLGVREFSVNNVLDRLRGSVADVQDPDKLVRFLWSLLSRERLSEFGTRDAAQSARTFDPCSWHWAAPRGSEAKLERMRRLRDLAAVPLPTRAGGRRAAGELAFGADWANWLEDAVGDYGPGAAARLTAYRAIEQLTPGHADLLGPPEEVLALVAADVPVAGEDDPTTDIAREQHAFLLRLGVWEVLPVIGFAERSSARRINWPFQGHALHAERRHIIVARTGWDFDERAEVGARPHREDNVWVAEDYHLAWDLERAAERDPVALARSLSLGASLYTRLSQVVLFCNGCRVNGRSHNNPAFSEEAHGLPSLLAVQLRTARWVQTVADGRTSPTPVAPADAWRSANYPEGQALRTSPLRFLPIVADEHLTPDLLRLSGIVRLENAPSDRVLALLRNLRERLAEDGERFDRLQRQAFIGLHQRAYRRLHDLDIDALTRETLTDIGVLCLVGDCLEHRAPQEARHDNGEFSAQRRVFDGRVAFVCLQRDRQADARALGVPTFEVDLVRRGNDEGQDVSLEVQDALRDRLPELFALLVHHSLGSQTLDPSGEQFEQRANRVRRLRARRLEDLVIDATVRRTDLRETIGERTDQDVHLDRHHGPHATLYFDFPATAWRQRLLRRIAGPLAQLLDSPAYEATFQMLLTAESDDERLTMLHDRGIKSDDVDEMAASLGLVSLIDETRHERWVRALAATLGLDEASADAFTGRGLPTTLAEEVLRPAADDVRRDPLPTGVLARLADAGVDLGSLHGELRQRGDEGLRLEVGRGRLRHWLDAHRHELAAALSSRLTAADAKRIAQDVVLDDRLDHVLDPEPQQWLAPVLDALARVTSTVDSVALASTATEVLAAAAGFPGAGALEDRARELYDAAERARALQLRATTWRAHVLRVGVVVRATHGHGHSALRRIRDEVDAELPKSPAVPGDLRDASLRLLGDHTIAEPVGRWLEDDLVRPSDPEVEEALLAHGLDLELVARVQAALRHETTRSVREVRERMSELTQAEVPVQVPPGLRSPVPPTVTTGDGTKAVKKIKVDPAADKRRRQVGAEGEQWALAATTRHLLDASPAERRHALGEVHALLDHFEGEVVDEVRTRFDGLDDPNLDEDDLINGLVSALHVSLLSDGFGFDVLAWLPSRQGEPPQAMCLEVKSARGRRFHLSANEWERAQRLHADGPPGAYAVLVVRRSPDRRAPRAMDLLPDPVALLEDGRLFKKDDTFMLTYTGS